MPSKERRESFTYGASEDPSTAVAARYGMETAGIPSTPWLTALTILAHPDPARIGERVLLGELAAGRRARIGRGEPSFTGVRDRGSRPLGDRFLSRTPITLRSLANGGLILERGESPTPVEVDGTPLIDRLEVPSAKLEAGTVALLAGRVALLLHRASGVDRPSPPAYGMVGESDSFLELRRALERVATTEVPVLVEGPTGSGKELVARALHHHGPRPDGPFVAVNVGALTPTLAAAELFGARKGAFTGAVRDRAGRFLEAHGGTLFLDEIGEAPAELQVALLRALETGEVTPVGGQAPRRADVRVVAATDASLEERVEQGTFRAPLLHRLTGYRLRVPSLGERRDDVPRLLHHFLELEHRRLRRPSPALPLPLPEPGLVARLTLYSWPGNVRELRNVARELVIDHPGSELLAPSPRLDALLPPWRQVQPNRKSLPASPPQTRRRRKPSEVSEEELLEALRQNRFDLKATARALGVSRTGLYSRIGRSPNVRTAADVPEDEIRRAQEEHGGDLAAIVAALEVSERGLRQRLKDLGLR